MTKIQRGMVSLADDTYEKFLAHIYNNGTARSDRTGTGTRGVFGYQMRFDLYGGLPVVTTKKVHLRSVIAELLWFISGSTNIKPLHEMGCTIWDEWADENGDLGPVYGNQWRSWPTPEGGCIDQLSSVIEALKTDPFSRRHVVSAWNVASLDKMALPPCHLLFQFHVRELEWSERVSCLDPEDDMLKSFSREDWERRESGAVGEYMQDIATPKLGLSCQLYQRSADAFLGVPFNITSYALLTHMVAAQLGYAPLEFIWTGGDCHIYSNHFAQVEEQIARVPFPYPTLHLPTGKSIFEYTMDDIVIENYQSHAPIKGKVAV